MNPDWTLLPPEILRIISEELISVYDFVRFRAVCNTWRSASSPRPKHLPPQLPWLILPHSFNEYEANHGFLSVYDLSQSRTHILDLPEIKGKRICGSSNGWLILEDREVWSDLESYLFNPVTRDQISLPSFYADPNVFVNLSGEDSKDYFLAPNDFRIRKATLSSNPGIDPDCLVMAIFEGSWELAFCRIGDERWTVISEYLDESEDNAVEIGYHSGLFYVLNGNGHVRICDMLTPSYKVINLEKIYDYIRHVEGGCNEHGLMILGLDYYIYEYSPVAINSIMTWSDKQEHWLDVEEEHLRDNVLFLGFGRHFHCLSLPVVNMKLEEWEGNCMCYISCQSERIDDMYLSSCSIKLFRLNDGSERTIASNVRLFHSKTYYSIYDHPNFIWLTPTLC